MNSLALLPNLAGPDMLIIFLIVLIMFGAKKLPELAKGLGQAVREFSKAKEDMNSELNRAAHVDVPSYHPPVEQALPSAPVYAPAPVATATATATVLETAPVHSAPAVDAAHAPAAPVEVASPPVEVASPPVEVASHIVATVASHTAAVASPVAPTPHA
jgi:sec-independent protein translocase protein TatA